MTNWQRSDVRFESHGDECAAWLYTPETQEAARPPLVIMGHGLGAVREMRLDAYAERFAAAGIAALVFTYRHFGDSGGEPRQLLDIGHQLEDWAAALVYARSELAVDSERIALWGTSFGGGHVLRAAADDGNVAAVVSQCPFTDGLASMRALGVRSSVRTGAYAARDVVASFTRRKPVTVPLVGKPGSAALMTAPDAQPGYEALMPADVAVEGEVAARIATRIGWYTPGRSMRKLQCPTLLCVCDKDSVAPAKATLRHARGAANVEAIEYPYGHFEIYVGEAFEHAVSDQTAFLERHLG